MGLILASSCLATTPQVRSQPALVYIHPDGSVTGTENILQNGNYYFFINNITGSIIVQRSNIILDGAGYTLEGHGGTGIDLTNNLTAYPSPDEIQNVTIENMNILNFNWSINGHGSSYNTIYHDYIGSTTNETQSGILVYWNRGGYNITHCTISGTIAIELSSWNSITENNLSGMLLQVVGNETIDGNFWSDYLTKYHNATELDSTGIGNIPYTIEIYENGVVNGSLQDNHPMMKPIVIPNLPAIETASTEMPTASQSLTSATSSSPSVPEFPMAMAIPVLVAAAFLGLAIYGLKRGKGGKRV
jgi:hypothetical protein